ncbi:MAG: PAS domain-containing protein [Kiritimatiellales bacterium]|nr:PAS domain-containing protein [Kiritimatiellota bacterium]MBL7012368.1 PAS domain-containing protein [Kiritimatiellales bacterium]
MKSRFLDKLIDRLDRLDSDAVQTQFLHLAREKGLLETIFQAIQEGVVVVGAGARIRYANRTAESLFGFQLDDAEGQPIARYIRDIDWEKVLNLDEDEWEKLVRREIEVSYPDHRFVEFYVVPLAAGEEGEPSPIEQGSMGQGAVVIFRDVTRDRASTEESIESERMKALTLLAAGVAHEIGNPLNAVTIHLQLMERELEEVNDPALRDSLTELVEVSRREVHRLDRIITQFLRAIRPTLPDRKPVEMERILDETLELMKHDIANRRILVERKTAKHVPTVPADETQVKQAFFNIIKNALQAMESEGILKITTEVTSRFVSVCFADNGPGISSEDLGAIYEPYRTTKEEGSGLGLMIVQRILRDHGGEIEISSTPDHGTAFTLHFPRDDVRMALLEAPSTKDEL